MENYLNMRVSVKVIAFGPNNEVLLLQKRKINTEGHCALDGPGGKIDHSWDKTIFMALARECIQEIGSEAYSLLNIDLNKKWHRCSLRGERLCVKIVCKATFDTAGADLLRKIFLSKEHKQAHVINLYELATTGIWKPPWLIQAIEKLA